VLRVVNGLNFFSGESHFGSCLINAPFGFSYGPFPNVPLSAGLPVPMPGDPNNPSGFLTAEAKDFRSGYLQQFNLNLQKAIGANVFSVAYVGELGRHLPQELPNLALPFALSRLPTLAHRYRIHQRFQTCLPLDGTQTEGAIQLQCDADFIRAPYSQWSRCKFRTTHGHMESTIPQLSATISSGNPIWFLPK